MVGSSRLCYDPRPVDKELCYTPCDNDCVTSSWSDWSSCSADCGVGRQAGYRSRQKTILAQANSGKLHQHRIEFSFADVSIILICTWNVTILIQVGLSVRRRGCWWIRCGVTSYPAAHIGGSRVNGMTARSTQAHVVPGSNTGMFSATRTMVPELTWKGKNKM